MADGEVSLDDVFKVSVQNSGATTRTDAIVIAVHACLISDGFHLIAVGDEGFETKNSLTYTVSLSDSDNPGLPNGWNSSHDVYAFQYKPTLTGDKVCLVKALPIGDHLVTNVLCSNDPSNIITLLLPLDSYTDVIPPDSVVTIAMYKNTLKLFTTISNEINARIKQKFASSSKSNVPSKKGGASSKATPTEPTRDPLRVGDVRRPHPFVGGYTDPFAYGSSDLSPFGGPGGMIMDPMRHGGIRGAGPILGPPPPGFHPPGARFDPVSPFGPTVPRPPNQGGRGGGNMYGPDPDHLPPPGSDDWFS